MAYSYGPPPPAPPPAAPNNGPGAYGSYSQPYQQPSQRGGHASRGRGGGPDRGGYHQSPPAAYSYGPQAPTYGPQSNAPYPGPQPPQTAYPAPQQQQQQQWHPEHAQQHPQQPNAHTPLPAQNYHPNYAPQIYGHAQPQPYGQPPYAAAPTPHYGPVYPAAGPQPGLPAHQWSGHAQPPNQTSYGGGGGRGGGRGYNDRGGHKAHPMGPPIRMGFDSSAQPAPPAPVSNPYPTTPYGAQGPPGPYPPAPYQGYPAPVPYVQGPQYDGHSGHNPRHRGGFNHQNNKPRTQYGGGKDRNRNQKGHMAQTPPTYHQKPDAASTGKKKKRKTNTLGLTPGDDSDDCEENEEELDELYGADAPKPTDIAAWIAERRANFPTKARVEAKKTAAVSGKQQNGDAAKKDEEQALLEQKAENLRRELEKVESNIKRKREQQDEGDDMRNMDLGSPPSLDSKSDDEKPEVMSTRQQDSNVPPPTRKADPKKHCKYYSTGGNCGKRGKCRFVHDPLVREQALKDREMNGGRMTLQHRLTLNDKHQEDLTIVQSLKYLQDKGVFTKDTPAAGDSNAANAEPEEKVSTLPPPPIKREGHGLPPIPPLVWSRRRKPRAISIPDGT
ncbi:hypothetical protein B0T18DRAFT_72300 [Schizothecium vesticola]|uniref:C3H1-type domain-containing protein n=1 Tax=Schizothecium vesticola TaxID=314040 RepID=A0AA40KAE6_9PEZI|nr:hypothetical protein B0T18DRAFT_72300 [Schizothecium vesticola]